MNVAEIDTKENGTMHLQEVYIVEDVFPKKTPLFFACKRLFDILLSAFLLIILCIPMVLVAILIRLDTGGPAVYCQERLGKDGKPFLMYKFRSMYLDAEANGPQWAEVDDPRCTKLGRILRKCRIDELPQLWNILVGDMSFVGPRPERAFFYEKFEQTINGFRNRLRVTPGLTGLAQVNGGYDLRPKEKVIWDMEYIRTQSVRTDLLCLLKTVKLVFTQEGTR